MGTIAWMQERQVLIMQIVGYDPKFKEAFIEMNKAWIDQVIQHFELSGPSLHPHYRDFLTTTTRADFLWQTFFDRWVPSLLLKISGFHRPQDLTG